MSRRARQRAHARPWMQPSTHIDLSGSDDDDESLQLDHLLGQIPGDDESTEAHDMHQLEHARTSHRNLGADL